MVSEHPLNDPQTHRLCKEGALGPQAQRCVLELKGQVNRLEAKLEEQTTHKQMALVDNEHLRMEVEALRCTGVANAGAQVGYKEADCEYSWAVHLHVHYT